MDTRRLVPAVVLALGVAGCGAPTDGAIGVWQQEGLTFNGLTFNGLTFNGLTFNGLTFNGTPSATFADWFNNADGGDVALHDTIMHYVIGCAIKGGRTASFVDGAGLVHTWPGNLGLADDWDQNPPTSDEKQWVSACLMAHVNSALPAPKHIELSLRGAAPGLTSTLFEKATVMNLDGVFFGDLFTSPNKRYLCKPTWTPPTFYASTLLTDWGRQCYFSSDGCGGLFTQVDCTQVCGTTTGDYSWGPTCSVDGVTYNAISAYVPRFKKAQEFLRSGTALSNCTGCLEGNSVSGFSPTSYFTLNGVVNNGSSGAALLDVRYSLPGPSATGIKVWVGTTAVMNGSSAVWDMPVTGGSTVWKNRTVTVPLLSNGATVKIQGTGSSTMKVDAVVIRPQE